MSYMTAQGLIKTLLLTLTSTFPSGSVTEGDLRCLDTGGLTNYAVLFPGAVISYDTATNDPRTHEWECLIDLFTRFVDDTSYSTFGTLRDTVISKLDTSQALSATYFIMRIESDGDPAELFDKIGGGPFFITQRLRVYFVENT